MSARQVFRHVESRETRAESHFACSARSGRGSCPGKSSSPYPLAPPAGRGPARKNGRGNFPSGLVLFAHRAIGEGKLPSRFFKCRSGKTLSSRSPQATPSKSRAPRAGLGDRWSSSPPRGQAGAKAPADARLDARSPKHGRWAPTAPSRGVPAQARFPAPGSERGGWPARIWRARKRSRNFSACTY